MKSRLTLLVASLALTLSWAQTRTKGQDESTFFVNGGDSPLSIIHILDLFERERIGAMFQHGIKVAGNQKYLKRVHDVIEADAKLYPWHYSSPTGSDAARAKWEKNFQLRQFDADLADFRNIDQFRRDGNLRGLAREAFDLTLSLDPKHKRDRPFIKSMKLWPMPYLGPDEEVHLGYKARVEVGYRAIETRVLSIECYVWDDGRTALPTACDLPHPFDP